MNCLHKVYLLLWSPKSLLVVFGPQLIYKWALSQSYQLSSKLHLVSPTQPSSPYPHCYPLFFSLVWFLFFSISLPLYFSNLPLCWPTSPFYSLLLVGLSSLPFSHFTHISTSIKIPRNPHNFRGFSWNLF